MQQRSAFDHRRTIRRILLSAIIVMLGVLDARVLHAEQESLQNAVVAVDAASEAARHIRLIAARRTRTSGKIAAAATVEPDADAVAQVTTQIPARVVRLLAALGDRIQPGQPLAILSSVELGEAKAEFLKSRSLEAIAAQNLKREQQLYTKQISALKDELAAQAAYDTALAEYQAVREKLTLLIPADAIAHLKWSGNGTPLSEFPLTSPIAGTLVSRDLVVGEFVTSDHPLMTVVNLDKVWVNANIYESDLAAVKVGDRAIIHALAYPERSFEGQTFYIGDEVDRKTRTVRARIEVPNPGHLLKPGMFAHTIIQGSGGSREVVVVPDSAVFDYQDNKIVFTTSAPNRYQARLVEVGDETQEGVEILSGLSEGDQVVAHGGLALKGLLMNRRSQ